MKNKPKRTRTKNKNEDKEVLGLIPNEIRRATRTIIQCLSSEMYNFEISPAQWHWRGKSKIVHTFIVIWVLIGGTNTVRLLQDSVIPPHALRGQKAVLRCNYDLEGDNLYSVKWYFNQKEFYRYIPTDNPPVTIFNHHPGVNVNPQLSTTKEVVLDEIDFLTSGQYRCEISGDAPKFQTASAEGLLFVVDLPDNGPDILGGRPRYTVGDHVNVTCASRNSLPAAKLSWYINGEKADSNHLIPYSHETNHEGLQTSKLGLGFKVDHKHFTRGDLKLKCTATISTVYWKSNEESVQGAGYNAFSTSMSPARGMSSGGKERTDLNLKIMFLLVPCLFLHMG